MSASNLEIAGSVFAGSNYTPFAVSGGVAVKAGKTKITAKDAGVYKVYFPESLIDAGASALKASGFEYIGRVKNAAKFKGDINGFGAFVGAVAGFLASAAPAPVEAAPKAVKPLPAPGGSLADKPRDSRPVEAIRDANARKALPAKRA